MESMDTAENILFPHTLDEQVERYHAESFEVQKLCVELLQKLENFSIFHENYEQLKQTLCADEDGLSELDSVLNLLQPYQKLCSDVDHLILFSRNSVESKLSQVYTSSFTLCQNLLDNLVLCQTQRSSKLRNDFEQTIKKAFKLATFLSQVSVIVSNFLVYNPRLVHLVSIISNYKTYNNQFPTFLGMFEQLEILTRKKFGFVMDCMPPSVINTGSPRDISLRLFSSLLSPTTSQFSIKTYLVHEATVAGIQKDEISPDEFESIEKSQLSDNEKSSQDRSRQSHSILGKIFLDGDDDCNGHHDNLTEEVKNSDKNQRSSQDKIPHNKVEGHIVQNLNGTLANNRICHCFHRRLTIIDRPEGKTDPKEKYCLLFITEVSIAGKKEKLWIVSLPFCIISHVNQKEKAGLPMVWYDVVANHQPGLLDLKVATEASWFKIQQIFSKACEVITGRPLDDHHFELLKQKAEEMIFNDEEVITDDTKISKDDLFGSSLWQYFYACLSTVRIGSPLNEIWMDRKIDGFVSFEAASKQLEKSLSDENIKEKLGLFTIRFSDTKLGGLTFVYVKMNNQKFEITRLEPVEIIHKKMKECSDALLRHLNARDESNGNEAFKYLLPGNVKKKLVFKKFYDYAETNRKLVSKYDRLEATIISSGNWFGRMLRVLFPSHNNN